MHGWKQGCRLRLTLPRVQVRHEAGKPKPHTEKHDEWVIAQQDCDLAWRAVAGTDTLIELHPVLHDNPPSNWGIRDLRFRLDESGAYLHADEPSVRVTPDVVLNAEHCSCPTPDLARRLKTWLGLRYDRPAIPQEFMDLADDIAKRLRKPGNQPSEERVRDVLATFRRSSDGVAEFELVAVVPHAEADADPGLLAATRDWSSTVVLAVPDRLGMPLDIEARRDDQVSLALLERSFSLDVSQVSWPETKPGPGGAV